MKNTSDDKRTQKRDPLKEHVEFSILGVVVGHKEFLDGPKITGSMVDISKTGIGLTTDTPLQIGNLVKFSKSNPNKLGVVMWTLNAGDAYRAGVRFI
ncbi:MAG: PilZ domain-containing protein [Nitrospirae bacterium]|nr:PilZ domain-containing protein [Nitrospirota bacterium]